MKVLIINLKSATGRKAFQEAQMSRLGLNHEMLSAVDAVSPGVGLGEGYWSKWERPLRQTERACLLSHVNAWTYVLHSNEPHLILEDDAVLSKSTKAFLGAVAGKTGIDHITLETRGRRKIIAKRGTKVLENVALYSLFQDRSGAAAYILFPDGAKKLLKHFAQRPSLADGMICSTSDLKSYQVVPALAIQLDQCTAHGLIAPLNGTSSISTEAKQKSTARQKARRIWAQIGMALRFIWKFPVSQRMLMPTLISSESNKIDTSEGDLRSFAHALQR